MGNLFPKSELEEDKNFVGAYTFNPCKYQCSPSINNIFCCGRPAWREGGGFAIALNDGVPLKTKLYPQWEKGSRLRTNFEAALEGEKMKRVILEEVPRNHKYDNDWSKITPIVNKKFCHDINEELLKPYGFRCEARFWITWPTFVSGDRRGRREEESTEHFALAIYKIDPNKSMHNAHSSGDENDGECQLSC